MEPRVIYMVYTGLHGLHVAIGMGLIAWLIYSTYKGNLTSEYYTPMEMIGILLPVIIKSSTVLSLIDKVPLG